MRRTLLRSAAVIVFLFPVLLCAAQLPPPVPSTAVTASASSEFYPPLTAASLTIDGSGLTGDLHDNHPQGHTMWLSVDGGGGSVDDNPAGIPGPAWLLYEFQAPFRLTEAWIWNHNQENLTDRGLRNVDVRVTADRINWTVIGTFELTRAPGTPDYPPGDIIEFGGVTALQVLITAAETEGNYGSAYYGLSEIRFYGEELPCTPEDFPFPVVSVRRDEAYNQLLAPRSSGWIGSDVAHSTPLDDNRTLWLFGDTLLGTVQNGARTITGFINNSVGIQDRATTPPAGMTFYWGPSNTSFFPHQPGTPGSFYWPSAAFQYGGELFIFCFSVSWGGGGLGFTVEGTTMIRIPNPEDPPAEWVQQAFDFGIGDSGLGFHSALYIEEPYIYFFGYEDQAVGGRAMVLARMTSADLLAGGLAESLEFWTDPGSGPGWSFAPDSLVPLFHPGVTETDVHFIPSAHRYFLTTYNPFTPTIYLSTAPSLTGPWTEPACVYNVPEHQQVSFSIISYAARLHPDLSADPFELVISYATNSLGGLSPLTTLEGLAIYSPRFIRVRLQEPTASGVAGWLLF